MKKTFIPQHSCSLKYTILFYDMGSYFKTLLFFLFLFLFLKVSFLTQLLTDDLQHRFRVCLHCVPVFSTGQHI